MPAAGRAVEPARSRDAEHVVLGQRPPLPDCRRAGPGRGARLGRKLCARAAGAAPCRRAGVPCGGLRRSAELACGPARGRAGRRPGRRRGRAALAVRFVDARHQRADADRRALRLDDRSRPEAPAGISIVALSVSSSSTGSSARTSRRPVLSQRAIDALAHRLAELRDANFDGHGRDPRFTRTAPAAAQRRLRRACRLGPLQRLLDDRLLLGLVNLVAARRRARGLVAADVARVAARRSSAATATRRSPRALVGRLLLHPANSAARG